MLHFLILTTQSLLKTASMTKSKASSVNQQTNVKAVEKATCSTAYSLVHLCFTLEPSIFKLIQFWHLFSN